MGKINRIVKFSGVPPELNDFARSLYDILTQIINEFDGKIETVNFRGGAIEVADTGNADTEFTVTHNLGKIPIHYAWNIDKEGVVYDSRRNSWTTTVIYLKCSVANAALTLFVM